MKNNQRDTLWQDWQLAHPKESAVLARVMEQKHHQYICEILNTGEQVKAKVTPKLREAAGGEEDFPVVGDWVALDITKELDRDLKAVLGILPRQGALRRAAAGLETRQQILSANLDYLLLVFGLDGGRNFVPAMLERSLTTAWDSGAKPLIVLNKADCATDEEREQYLQMAEDLAFGIPIYLVSAKTGEGIGQLAELLTPGTLTALFGKSGVGKSALVNALAGENNAAIEGRQRYGDRQGRHTTSHSRIYALPSGALIADLPGLRELKIWGEQDNLDETFPEIARFAQDCRFRDCRHESEPGCAVQKAMDEGNLDQRRFASYQKLQKELDYLHRRQDQQAAALEKAKWKQIHKTARKYKKPGRE